MQSDAERWELASTLHRVFGGRRTDHEACSGKNSFAMGAFNGLVQRDGEAKVIRRHDEPFHPPSGGICNVEMGIRGFH